MSEKRTGFVFVDINKNLEDILEELKRLESIWSELDRIAGHLCDMNSDMKRIADALEANLCPFAKAGECEDFESRAEGSRREAGRDSPDHGQ